MTLRQFQTVASLIVFALIYQFTQYLTGFSLSVSVSAVGLLYFEVIFQKIPPADKEAWAFTFHSIGVVVTLIMLSQSLSILTGMAVSRDLSLTHLVASTPYEYMAMGATFSLCSAMLLLLNVLTSAHTNVEECAQQIKQGLLLLHLITTSALYVIQPQGANLIAATSILSGVLTGVVMAYHGRTLVVEPETTSSPSV